MLRACDAWQQHVKTLATGAPAQECLSALAGLTLAARAAGTKHATNATAANRAGTTVKVAGSRGATP
jgi:hypothetical protein